MDTTRQADERPASAATFTVVVSLLLLLLRLLLLGWRAESCEKNDAGELFRANPTRACGM